MNSITRTSLTKQRNRIPI
uniref:Uncharacterized protein n=1 Tax=Arundo donax TaxID=35708 RepID=A0A0A9F5D2_ARUDO